eukprot:SAG31_NODE_760_length_12279_cov_2.439655_1_plen_241_part_00
MCSPTGGISVDNPSTSSSGNTNNQPIIFGCIDFYSAYCDYNANENSDGSYDAALAEFAACAEVTPEPPGYCHGSLPTAAFLRNQAVCLDGASRNIAFHIRIPFQVYQAGQYTFRMHVDYGMGSFIGIDGAEHTPGNTWGHVQSDALQLAAGNHEFEALGFEDCCDGHAELEVHLVCDQVGGPWRIVKAGDTPCLQCSEGSPPPPPPPPADGCPNPMSDTSGGSITPNEQCATCPEICVFV